MKIWAPIIAVVAIAAIIAGVFGLQRVNKPTSATTTNKETATVNDQLQSTDEVVGTGDEAVSGKTVSVQYTGTLTDGTKFDSTADHGGTPFEFALGSGQVIKGWDQGVVGMKVGGKRKLVIPASLGYGSQANGAIPANSTLVFEIELVGVK